MRQDLLKRLSVKEICAKRDAALSLYNQAANLREDAQAKLAEADEIVKSASQGQRGFFYGDEKRKHLEKMGVCPDKKEFLTEVRMGHLRP